MSSKHRNKWADLLMGGAMLALTCGCLPDNFLGTRLMEISVQLVDSILAALTVPLLQALP